jgi:CDGSH-type Zn-finger protein
MAIKKEEMRIKITKDGPYRVTGGLPLYEQVIVTDEAGHTLEFVDKKEYPLQETYILCRCGASKNKPFCDGTHMKISFDGSETASRKPYLEKAEVFEGPELELTDAPEFCDHSRFCLRAGGIRSLIQKSVVP